MKKNTTKIEKNEKNMLIIKNLKVNLIKLEIIL